MSGAVGNYLHSPFKLPGVQSASCQKTAGGQVVDTTVEAFFLITSKLSNGVIMFKAA